MARGLGKGLASLIPEPEEKKATIPSINFPQGASGQAGEVKTVFQDEEPDLKHSVLTSGIADRIINVAPENISKNPLQPRHNFNQEKLRELANSISRHGILQPLVVTQNENGYELISGERRLEAAKLAGLKTVPVIVREAKEQDKLELALVENLQRSDLNPIEEARAYAQLEEQFSLTQEEIGQKVSKSRPAVANSMRLLTLPSEIQKALFQEVISEGQARAILGLKNDQERLKLFAEILRSGGMTVRTIEEKVKKKRVGKQIERARDPQILDLENSLQRALSTKVRIQKRGGKGKILIDFYSTEELETIVDKLSPNNDLDEDL